MEINADFSRAVLVHGADLDWQPSPMAGVERRMLDRIGNEKARATSIVRYAPGSHFSAHTHGGGEEFLVLEGVFQDEHGDYPAGSYVRNPPESSHKPGAEVGCVILVKLWQFEPDDRTPIRVESDNLPGAASPDHAGLKVKPLFRDANETVRLEIWQPGAGMELDAPGGLEILVVNGTMLHEGKRLRRWSWLRLPVNSHLSALAGAAGCKLWVKTGHLAHQHLLEAPST